MFTDWLAHHLLPCPVKQLTGIDCPGCGMQRSFLLLLKGDFAQSIHLYPGLLPVLVTFVFLALHLKFRFTSGAKVLQIMYIFSAAVILVSYVVKEANVFAHS